MSNFAVETPEIQAKTEYLRLCPYSRHVGVRDLKVFQEVMQRGSPEEQISATDELAFLRGRSVRRALIGIMGDASVLLQVRERATEMLHLQSHRETVEACAIALRAQTIGIRFWAAYTLGNLGFSGTALGAIAASALEGVLRDPEIAPGWWSVGREAQALIPALRGDSAEEQRLQEEIRRILEDPNAPPEDRRWAECYMTE